MNKENIGLALETQGQEESLKKIKDKRNQSVFDTAKDVVLMGVSVAGGAAIISERNIDLSTNKVVALAGLAFIAGYVLVEGGINASKAVKYNKEFKALQKQLEQNKARMR